MKIGMAGVALSLAASAAAATPTDGFGVFWPAFQKAVAADDQKALAGMVALSPDLDPYLKPLTFAAFHAQQLKAKARACLAKAKPVRDVDGTGQVTYSAFCGEMIYVFEKRGGAWKLAELGVND